MDNNLSNPTVSQEKVAVSFLWKFLERLFSQGINLLVQIVLARILLPEDFGILAIVVAIMNFLSIFVQSGLSTAIVQRKSITPIEISTLLTFSVAVASVLYVGVFFSAPLIASYYELPDLLWILRVLGITLILNAINSIQTAILSRRMAFKTLFVRTAIAIPAAGALGIVLALLGFGVWALVAQTIANVLIIIIFMSFDRSLRIRFGFSKESFLQLYGFSSKILLASLISSGHDSIRTMVIGKKYSEADLAYYDRGLTYSGYVSLIINATISGVLLPAFSQKQDDPETLRGMARRSVKLASFVMIPVLLGVAALSEPLIRIVLTEKWLPCVPFLVLFCILRIPGCIFSVDKQIYFAIGKSGLNLFYEATLLVMNLTVLIVMANYSIMAIAIGALVIELLGAIVLCIISAKVYGYSVGMRIKDIIKPLFASAVMIGGMLALGALPINGFVKLLLQVLLGIALYFGSSLLLRDDSLFYTVNILKNIKNRREGKNI